MFNIRMLVMSILLSVFCCPLASHAEPDEASMMATAKGHYQEGGYYYASTWLERILTKWPDTAQREEILVMMAKSYAATGREEKAARTLNTLLQEYPQAAAKLDRDLLKLVREPDAAPRLPVLQAVGEPAPAPVAPAVSERVQISEVAVAAPAAVAPPVAVEAVPVARTVATAGAENNGAATAVPDAGSAAPAAAKAPIEVKAPVAAEAPIKPEVAAPAVQKIATPAVAPLEPATAPPPIEVKAPVAAEAPIKPDVARPAVAEVAAPAVAPSNPVPLSVDALKEPETETACRDNSATARGTYAIELGEFIGKNALVRGKKAVKKAGLLPVVGTGRQKVAAMLRIQVGEFTDEGAAKKMLNKLRKAGTEQFMLKDKEGTFRIYAGSYFEHQAALDEQKRLSGKGLPSELKEATVPVPTYVINAGCFPTEQAAKGKLAELERLGLKGRVLPPQ